MHPKGTLKHHLLQTELEERRPNKLQFPLFPTGEPYVLRESSSQNTDKPTALTVLSPVSLKQTGGWKLH